MRAVARSDMWAKEEVSKDKCLLEKQQQKCLGRSLEYVCLCVCGNPTKPQRGFCSTWGFRAFGICSCCYTHTVFLDLCFSRAAQVLRDLEETEENPATP